MTAFDPQPAAAWLARSAAEKARAFSKDLAEFIFTDEPDPVVDALIARSAAARQSIADWPENRVDALITDLAAQLAGHADELAAATVTETGICCVADKVEKNLFGSLGVATSLVGKPGVGVIGERESLVAREAGAEPIQAHFGLGFGDSGRDDREGFRRADPLGDHTLYYDALSFNVHFVI